MLCGTGAMLCGRGAMLCGTGAMLCGRGAMLCGTEIENTKTASQTLFFHIYYINIFHVVQYKHTYPLLQNEFSKLCL